MQQAIHLSLHFMQIVKPHLAVLRLALVWVSQESSRAGPSTQVSPSLPLVYPATSLEPRLASPHCCLKSGLSLFWTKPPPTPGSNVSAPLSSTLGKNIEDFRLSSMIITRCSDDPNQSELGGKKSAKLVLGRPLKAFFPIYESEDCYQRWMLCRELVQIKGGGISRWLWERERIREKPQKDHLCHRNLHLIVNFEPKTSLNRKWWMLILPQG